MSRMQNAHQAAAQADVHEATAANHVTAQEGQDLTLYDFKAAEVEMLFSIGQRLAAIDEHLAALVAEDRELAAGAGEASLLQPTAARRGAAAARGGLVG